METIKIVNFQNFEEHVWISSTFEDFEDKHNIFTRQ